MCYSDKVAAAPSLCMECARSVCCRYRNGRGPLFHAQGRHFVSSMPWRCERTGLFPSTVMMPKVSCATRPGTIASAPSNPMPLIRQQILLTTSARRITLSRIKETPANPTQWCCCKHASTAFVLFVRDSLFATIFLVNKTFFVLTEWGRTQFLFSHRRTHHDEASPLSPQLLTSSITIAAH